MDSDRGKRLAALILSAFSAATYILAIIVLIGLCYGAMLALSDPFRAWLGMLALFVVMSILFAMSEAMKVFADHMAGGLAYTTKRQVITLYVCRVAHHMCYGLLSASVLSLVGTAVRGIYILSLVGLIVLVGNCILILWLNRKIGYTLALIEQQKRVKRLL